MKSTFKLAAVALAGLMFMNSCGSDSGMLSESQAKSAIKDYYMFDKDANVTAFNVGFFETSEETLNNYAQLQAAGMITFSVEKAVETVREKKYSWYGSYENVYTRDHYFVQVDLTDKGRSYVVENPVTCEKEIAKLKKQMEEFEPVSPDYLSVVYETPQQQIDNKVNEAVSEEEIAQDVQDSVVVPAEEVVEEVVEAEPAPVQQAAAKDENAKYNALVAKVSYESVYVRLFRYSLDKVFNVFCTEEMMKNAKAKCTAVIKYEDETPFGYVIAGPVEGKIFLFDASFTRYQDRGWVVSSWEKTDI